MAVRIPINLASVPFRRDRPLFVATIAACALLALGLLSQIGTIVSHRREAADTRAAIERTNAQLARLNAEQRKFDAGTSTVFLVLQRQSTLINTRSLRALAEADLSKDLAALNRATGRILDEHQISIKAR